jgi:hypothetical protein
MHWLRAALLGVSLLGSLGEARAEDYEAHGGTEHAYRHGGQFKIYGQLGTGYRMIFRYGDDYCGETGKTVCRSFTPAFIEAGIGYGVTNSFELLADVRVGLGEDFRPEGSSDDGPRQLVLAPGLRIFIDDLGSLKFFTTVQVAIDFTDYGGNVAAATDVGLRNVNGFLIDLHRTFGIYIHVGETMSFVRWLRFEIDGGVGMMVRVP